MLLLSLGKAGLGVISRRKKFKKVYCHGHQEKLGLGITIMVHQKLEMGVGTIVDNDVDGKNGIKSNMAGVRKKSANSRDQVGELTT